MEDEKSDEQLNDGYTKHIERFEGNPVVKRVIGEETKFADEIEGFYDIESWWECGFRAPPHEVSRLCDENPEKIGRAPDELIEILGKFCNEEPDAGKLRYELVREDYNRWHVSWMMKYFLTCLYPKAFGTIGILASVGYALNGDPMQYYLPSGLLGAAALALSFWSSAHNSEPEGTNRELQEYEKLLGGAEKADSFMDERYRNYFINKALEKTL